MFVKPQNSFLYELAWNFTWLRSYFEIWLYIKFSYQTSAKKKLFHKKLYTEKLLNPVKDRTFLFSVKSCFLSPNDLKKKR